VWYLVQLVRSWRIAHREREREERREREEKRERGREPVFLRNYGEFSKLRYDNLTAIV
jgi:hypothetical protein